MLATSGDREVFAKDAPTRKNKKIVKRSDFTVLKRPV
jgi:hypothetical protein